MVCELKYEIKKLLDSQQGLEVDKKGKEYIIQGLYKYSLIIMVVLHKVRGR